MKPQELPVGVYVINRKDTNVIEVGIYKGGEHQYDQEYIIFGLFKGQEILRAWANITSLELVFTLNETDFIYKPIKIFK